MTVRTTRTSDRHIEEVDAWWRAHRTKAPDLFLDELADAFALIEAAPELGRPWTESEVPGVRRVVMRATRYHVYYRVDGEGVVVLAVWSAVRGRGPRL
jgi:plasmid stabilization system protein ParE